MESAVDGRADGDTLPEVNGLEGALGNTLGGELKLGIDVLVGARSTEAVQAELLVSVLLPAHGGHDLNGQRGDAVGENAELVVLGLGVKDLEAGKRDDTGLDAVLLGEELDGVNGNADLGTGGDKGDVGTLLLVEDVATLDRLLDGGALQLGKVLAGESDDAGGVLGGESDVVGSRRLVAIGGAPDHAVGKGAEVSEDLDRLMGGTILAKTNGVVGGDPDGADLGQGGETDGTGGIGHEVEESTAVWDDGTIGSETVHDGAHAVLTDTITDVAAVVCAEAGRRGLEVDRALGAGKVGAGQIGGTTDKLGDGIEDLVDDNLGELSGSNGGVGRGVDGEVLLPALGKVTLLATDEVGGLTLVLLRVLGEQLVPLLLGGGAGVGSFVAVVIDLLGNVEALLGVEAELLLELLDVVSLEGSTVDTMGALLLGAETDDGLELDKRGLVLDLLGLLEGVEDALEVVVTVLDGDGVPAVRLVSLEDVLSESLVGVAVDGDVVVVPDGNEVAELEMAGERAGLGGDTLHQAAVAEEGVCVVVHEVVAGLVEDGGGVGLGHGKTNSVADTLAERASGDLDTGGVMGLGVTGGDAVDGL